MSEFVNLHVHSHYSILKAIPTVPELIKKAKEYNQPALALTDSNHLFGVPEFSKKAHSSDIKPIYGVHLEIMDQSRFTNYRENINRYSLVLLAKNFQGYQNLLKIVSIGYDDGSYGRFCVDKTLLQRYSSDIIALSSDSTGEMYHHAVNKDLDKLLECANFYQEIFDDFYIEIQDRNTSQDKVANKVLVDFAQNHNIPLVATNPVLYLNPQDSVLLDIVHCIRDKETLVPQQKDKDFIASERHSHSLEEISKQIGYSYFHTSEEMIEKFKDIPEAISNTVKIADMCDVQFPKSSDQSPQYPIPPNMTAGEFLKQKSFKELREKFDSELPLEYEKRLQLELDTVCEMGFPNYFLVVSDFVQYAKNIGIFVGPGRGSAAGALLSYALGITNVDPLKYDLLFERFLNPERVSMPDIDIDFEDDRRDEVKQYLRTHYGADKTADVVTFGYNKAKAVLKDVGRVLEIPLPRVNQITGMVDANKEIEKQIPKLPLIQEILSSSNQKEKLWIEYSIKLENRIRNLGTHASALIVAGNTLNNVIPLFKDNSNKITTAFEGKYLEENGLLKMDILGLSNLTIINDCLRRIYQNHQIWIDMDKIPLDDQDVFKMFSEGHTAGVFQFESVGMTSYLKQLQPTNIEDLIAMNALYRPGPMDSIPSFINRKHGKEEIDCFHKNLEPILKTTYGVIVYQEQVMQVAQTLSGFSLGEADIVRRIMAKKKPDELEAVRPKWVQGAINQGYDSKLAETLFELLIPFSNYAFNKSHAAAYSILAYQIAWLKTHYPTEFMASLMTSNMGKHKDTAMYVSESKNLNIDILLPYVNKSFSDFQVEDGAIRFGLSAIKGLGEQVIKELVKEREWGGDFVSVEDFIERTHTYIGKGTTDTLIKAGAFDPLLKQENITKDRAKYSEHINTFYQKYEKKNEVDATLSLFSSDEISATTSFDSLVAQRIPTPEEEFKTEIELFGFYLTQKIFTDIAKKHGVLSHYSHTLQEKLPIGTTVSLVGYVSDIYVQMSENIRRSWGKFSLNTDKDVISFFALGEKAQMLKDILQNNSFVYVKAQIIEDPRKNQRTYDILDISILNENSKPLYGELSIVLKSEKTSAQHLEMLTSIKTIAQSDYQNNAHNRLKFILLNDNTSTSLSAGSTYRILYPNDRLQQILKNPLILSYWVN